MPEESVEEYSVADIAEHVPKYKLIGGKLYQDGIEIREWQLTQDELLQWLPARYEQIYGSPAGECPMCKGPLSRKNIMNLTNHIRLAHRDWYARHSDAFRTITEYDNRVNYVTEHMEEVKHAES